MDLSLPEPFRQFSKTMFTPHLASIVPCEEWSGTRRGELPKRARRGFDALLTVTRIIVFGTSRI